MSGATRLVLHTLSWCARDNCNKMHSLMSRAFTGSRCRMATKQIQKTHTAGPTFSSTPQLLRLIWLIPDSKVLAHDVVVFQLAKTFTAIYGTRKIITELTQPMHQIFGTIMQVQINGFSSVAAFVSCWTASCESLTLRDIKGKQVYMQWGELHIYAHLLRRCRESFAWEVDIRSSYIWVSVVSVLINIVLCHSLFLVLN